MSEERTHGHLDAEAFQGLLEGDLPGGERVLAEEHLAVCARCSAERDAWTVLFQELDDLPALAPRVHFAPAVLERLARPGRASLAARIRAALTALRPGRNAGHVPASRLQDFAEGVLATRASEGVTAHLATCTPCRGEAEAWSGLLGRLDGLGRLPPAPGFAERVMAAARASAAAARRVPAWRRALAAAASLVPRTRRAWAAISGVAVAPAATAGLALYVIFSHPTLTPGALLSFAWWKASALVGSAWSGLVQTAVQSSELFGLYSAVEAIAGAPGLAAGGVLTYSVACALALRVLYKNLVTHRTLEPRYARVTAS